MSVDANGTGGDPRPARLDISSVSWAFERFAGAGIVEVVDGGCCRWRPELRYVLERVEPEAERLDPVCGMPVTADAADRARVQDDHEP